MILLLLVIAFLSGCVAAGEAVSLEKSGKIIITATVFPPYDFARNIVGDRAEVILLLPPSADSHTYEPAPRDILAVRESDIFLYIGGASDEWVRRVFPNEEGFTGVRLLDSVVPLTDTYHESHRTDYDEHIWTSPVNAVAMVRAICEAVSLADPDNAEFYRENAGEYIKELEALDEKYREIVAEGVRNTVIFADRFAFGYMTQEYGLFHYAAFPTCAEQAEPSALILAFLIEKIRDENIPVVFYGELSDSRTARSISRESGAEPLLLHSCHTLSQKEIDAGTDYLGIMRENAEALKRALN